MKDPINQILISLGHSLTIVLLLVWIVIGLTAGTYYGLEKALPCKRLEYSGLFDRGDVVGCREHEADWLLFVGPFATCIGSMFAVGMALDMTYKRKNKNNED